MNVWFQSADFTTVEDTVSSDDLKARFMAHPRSAELERRRRLEAEGVESCDPSRFRSVARRRAACKEAVSDPVSH